MLNVYYRVPNGDKKPKLRCVSVTDVAHYEDMREAIKDAKEDVMKQLHIEMEHFFTPILVLIKGGKK